MKTVNNYAFQVATAIASERPFEKIKVKELCIAMREELVRIEEEDDEEAFECFHTDKIKRPVERPYVEHNVVQRGRQKGVMLEDLSWNSLSGINGCKVDKMSRIQIQAEMAFRRNRKAKNIVQRAEAICPKCEVEHENLTAPESKHIDTIVLQYARDLGKTVADSSPPHVDGGDEDGVGCLKPGTDLLP